ncbi:histone acetyltransferase type B catalytic subunit isoform X2 [Manihot esculenta]|uniref:histone acetyltransferase type B catalytic subunit isoform X2 n=1 Tax=Manihot esculenta TaxID=3983 RepID=UPI001CC63297|nr:histone acetyltransferase type B catalytic subunit isoform X2 [Manihot esculenta]
MGQKQQPPTDPTAEHKKRRRVGFSNIDAGIEAKDCIKIYLVSSKEQVGASENYCIDPVDLNGFFDEDGKIYGYQGLKGGKGITELKSSLQRIFAETLVESKEDFLKSFSVESNLIRSIVSSGEVLQHKGSNEHFRDSVTHYGADTSDVKVVRMVIGNEGTGHLYSRLIPLVLLLVDGSNPIDVTDPGWELYVLVQEINDEQGDIQHRVLGFTAVYRFYHYPDKTRLRLSQILVLPPYQHKGYGRRLVEVVNNVAISEDVYDLTVEEPLDYFQHVRTCIDVQRLLVFSPIQDAINSAVSNLKQGKLSKKAHVPRFMPPSTAIEDVRKTLKINRKQFLQCWEVLIYLGLDPADKCMEDFVTIISNRVKADILGKDSGNGGKQVIEVPSDYSAEMSFVMFRTGNVEGGSLQMDENQTNQREQLQQLVDARIKEIQSIAQKLRPV